MCLSSSLGPGQGVHLLNSTEMSSLEMSRMIWPSTQQDAQQHTSRQQRAQPPQRPGAEQAPVAVTEAARLQTAKWTPRHLAAASQQEAQGEGRTGPQAMQRQAACCRWPVPTLR